jgi:hypothetical protein
MQMDMSALQIPVLHLDGFPQQGPELHLAVSAQQSPVLLLDLSTLQCPVLHSDLPTQWGLSITRTCLHYRFRCCTQTCLHTAGPELHRDVSAQQSLMLHLDGFPLQGPERTWPCPDTVACAAPGLIYTSETCAAHLDLSTHWGLSFTWTCLPYRFLCCTRTCFPTGA